MQAKKALRREKRIEKIFQIKEEPPDKFTIKLREHYRSLTFHYMHELKPGDLFKLARNGKTYEFLAGRELSWLYCENEDGKRGALHIEYRFYVWVYPC